MWEAEEEGRSGPCCKAQPVSGCLPASWAALPLLSAGSTKPREQIPFEEAGFHSAISPGVTEASHKAYKKKKGTTKGKGSKTHDAHDI